MMKKCITLNGEIINIGPWDYQVMPVYGPDPSRPIYDGEEVVGYHEHQVGEEVTNPFPPGAIEEEIEVVTTADGRIVRACDYQALRAGEYPSIGDQLDALYKAGVFPPEMAQRVRLTKERYPKPSVPAQ